MTDATTRDHEAVAGEGKGEGGIGQAGNAPVSVFQGTNSVMGTGRATAVTGTFKTVAGNSEIRYRLCLDTESLAEALNIKQSANLGFGLFGASEKTDFMKDTQQTSFSLNLVIYARHVTGVDTADNWSLKPGIQVPTSDQEKHRFFDVYGDSFVHSLEMGSEYYAVYSFYAQTFEERRSLQTELSASGILSGGSIGADFQQKIENSLSRMNVRVSMKQKIIGLRNPQYPEAKDIVSYALNFTAIEPNSPAILSCTATGYERVPGFNDFQPIARNRHFFLGDKSGGGLYGKLLQVDDLKNALTWLRKTYDSYNGFEDPPVNRVLGEATVDQDTLHALVNRYNADPLGSFSEPVLRSLTEGTPKLQYVVEYSSEQGGGGGVQFDDVDASAFLSRITRIRRIELRSGVNIDCLTVTYTDESGTTKTCKHGGDGGELRSPLALDNHQERVTKLSGRSGVYIDRLVIGTPSGQPLSGGGDGGSDFSWNIPSGAFLLGFRGRSGALLDRLQAVYARFKPAFWSHG